MYFGYGYGVSWWHFAMMFFWWIIIVVAMVSLVRWLAQPANGKSAALDILKERYAKGEITKKEFIEKRKDLLES